MTNYIITFYDLEDNILAQFDNYKECADYFETSQEVIRCYITRKKKKPNKKKRDKKNKIWGYLIKDNID